MTPAIKQRYFDKKYANAPEIECACKCGGVIKAVDRYARPQSYISGHNGRKYDDPKQFKREWNHRNRPARYASKKAGFKRKKLQLIEMLGGECRACNIKYDGHNACIFHLHHRDPSLKLFNVGNQLMNKSWAKIVAEANKCDLLCANCHELRHGTW
jgi:hypothetical protein